MIKFRVFEYDGWFEFHVYTSDELLALRMVRKTWGENAQFEIVRK